MTMENRGALFAFFARLIRYPEEGVAEAADQGRALLERDHPEAAADLGLFADFLRRTPATRLGEIYTVSFDLSPLAPPYVGHQLFGECRERTLFLFRLQQIYRRHGHQSGPDLPDHLAEILAFLAENPESAEAEVLAVDGLLPALEKMMAELEQEAEHPYLPLFRGVRGYLTAAFAAPAAASKEMRS